MQTRPEIQDKLKDKEINLGAHKGLLPKYFYNQSTAGARFLKRITAEMSVCRRRSFAEARLRNGGQDDFVIMLFHLVKGQKICGFIRLPNKYAIITDTSS